MVPGSVPRKNKQCGYLSTWLISMFLSYDCVYGLGGREGIFWGSMVLFCILGLISAHFLVDLDNSDHG